MPFKGEFKSFEVKAEGDGAGEGLFSGYASTWERDLGGDVVVKGAFADTLANDFNGDGSGIPIYWNHQYDSPMKLVGESTSAAEDEKGLRIEGRFDLDTAEGARAYGLVRSGRVHQMSIGYLPEETAWVRPKDAASPWDGYRELRRVKLFEVSVVPCAMNQGAEIDEVKGATVLKEPVTASAADEGKLRAAYDALGELLGSLEDAGSDGEDGEGEDGGGDGADGKSIGRAERAVEFKRLAEFFGGEGN